MNYYFVFKILPLYLICFLLISDKNSGESQFKLYKVKNHNKIIRTLKQLP